MPEVMQPGPEMDKKIAGLLGKKVCTCSHPNFAFGHGEYCFLCDLVPVSPYSTEIKYSLELLGKCAYPKMIFDPDGVTGPTWWVFLADPKHLKKYDKEWHCVSGEIEKHYVCKGANLLSHAICLAFIEVMEKHNSNISKQTATMQNIGHKHEREQ